MTAEIIAEVGVNHGNNANRARVLILEAKKAGANAVKFQASTIREEVSRRAAPEHYAMLKDLVPDIGFLRECAQECAEAGIEFLCTPAGLESLPQVVELGVKRIKVASDNLTNMPFLRAVAGTGRPIILSTGMADMPAVEDAMEELDGAHVTLLHCASVYPLPDDEANLSVLTTYKARWPHVDIGWSDHTTGTWLPAVAVALGAMMIEKHVTLDKNLSGPDHKASLTPNEFAQMVQNIRSVERAMGNGKKRVSDSERRSLPVYGKSLVAAHPIAKGDAFTADNITIKRPGTGIAASRYSATLGKVASRSFAEDELIA